jgi:hypothetical protein
MDGSTIQSSEGRPIVGIALFREPGDRVIQSKGVVPGGGAQWCGDGGAETGEAAGGRRRMIELRQVQSIVPVCMYCKSVRDERDCWTPSSLSRRQHASATVSQGICPECWERLVVPQLRELGCEEVAY